MESTGLTTVRLLCTMATVCCCSVWVWTHVCPWMPRFMLRVGVLVCIWAFVSPTLSQCLLTSVRLRIAALTRCCRSGSIGRFSHRGAVVVVCVSLGVSILLLLLPLQQQLSTNTDTHTHTHIYTCISFKCVSCCWIFGGEKISLDCVDFLHSPKRSFVYWVDLSYIDEEWCTCLETSACAGWGKQVPILSCCCCQLIVGFFIVEYYPYISIYLYGASRTKCAQILPHSFVMILITGQLSFICLVFSQR